MRLKIRICALLSSLAMIFIFTSCNSRRIVPPQSVSSAPVTSEELGQAIVNQLPTGVAFEGEFPAPKFKSGVYEMELSNTTEMEYSNVPMPQKTTYKYFYELNVNAGETTSITFKITRLIISFVIQGETVTLDTNNDNFKNEPGAQMYFAVVGITYTAQIAADGSITVTGIDEALAANPEVSELLDKNNLITIINDTFYPLPETITGTSEFRRETGGDNLKLNINFRAASRRNERVAFAFLQDIIDFNPQDISGSSTVTIKKYEPVSGTVWISETDRAALDQTSYQSYSGIMETQSETGKVSVDVTVRTSTNTKITQKG